MENGVVISVSFLHYSAETEINAVISLFCTTDLQNLHTKYAHLLLKFGFTYIRISIKEQSFEIDADSPAVCMLINLLMYDCVSKKVIDKQKYVKNQKACIMAALATVFCLFDNNAGADLSKLNHPDKATHPLPSTRMAYAEEIADVCLQKYFGNKNELREVESEWLRMVCDIEPNQKGIVDLGQVFYFTACIEKVQRHLYKLKHRLLTFMTPLNSTD